MPNWDGPKFTLTRDITTHDMVSILQMISSFFGNEYTLGLESITEGGIIFTHWPGKSQTPREDYSYNRFGYKSFRINVLDNGYWPPVNIDKWIREPARVIWNVPLTKRGTLERVPGFFFLKAYDGSPAWTQWEVDNFITVFEVHGFKCTHKKVRF